MPWASIDGFRKWTNTRKGLLQGLLGLAFEGVAGCVPGGELAVWTTRILGEFAKHGIERLANTSAVVPDVKPIGQSIGAEQLDQFNGWLGSLSTSCASLLDHLDKIVTLKAEEPDEQLPEVVRQALSQHADLAREFDACAEEVRRQTLSLIRVEERLDVIFHGQKGIALSLEEIKRLILQCAPLPGEWELFRRVNPNALRLLVQADEHFRAGRREEGEGVLLRLLQERGVGHATLCRRLGGEWLGEGKLKEAGECLQQVIGPDGRSPIAVTRALTSLTSSTTRGGRLPVWRSLPRGFIIEERWRIDSEVGRGGMASVYRAEGIDDINRGQIVAIKIPAPGMLGDSSSQQRFIQEIQFSQQLSRQRHPAIVETLGYVRLTDPHTQQPLYGLVLEFIDGLSLAQWLAEHKERSRQIGIHEIRIILESVCAALEHAHGQKPPILHRDLKPHNIMVGRDKRIRLMDFGIARVLEENRQTATGNVLGTWAYLPPEFLDPHYEPDIRSDIYLAANLLVELLTFHPQGNPEKRSDCPNTWLKLIGDSMNRVLSIRPSSIREFRHRLRNEGGQDGSTEKHVAKNGPVVRTRENSSTDSKTTGQKPLNSIGMKFAHIPAGKFRMGSPDSERERHPPEGPQHEVRIARAFYMGIYPVTQEEFGSIMGHNPAHFNAGNGDSSNHPVERVKWQDAIEFCRRLSNLAAERDAERIYRLPTEAEWEYACRAGTSTVFHYGNSLSSREANFDGSQPYGNAAFGSNLGKTTPVGSYPPNAFGLFDMHGNVWEWCSDWAVEWRDDEYYSISPKDDPRGLPQGKYRIIRGGSWGDPAKDCRSATRGAWTPGGRQNWLGFRVVLVVGAATY